MVESKKRPVIVFIHGGNFVRGSAAEYDPDYLLDQEVVLVSVQDQHYLRILDCRHCFSGD